jgi:hypothetical protein
MFGRGLFAQTEQRLTIRRVRNLSFNWRPILAPHFVLRYLVTHEAVHLAVPNHSAKFWLTVQSLCPEMERAKQWLSAIVLGRKPRLQFLQRRIGMSGHPCTKRFIVARKLRFAAAQTGDYIIRFGRQGSAGAPVAAGRVLEARPSCPKPASVLKPKQCFARSRP